MVGIEVEPVEIIIPTSHDQFPSESPGITSLVIHARIEFFEVSDHELGKFDFADDPVFDISVVMQFFELNGLLVAIFDDCRLDPIKVFAF